MRFNRPPQLIRHPRSATCFLGIYFFKFQYFAIHTINFHFKKAVKFSVCPLTARCARDAEWGTLRKQDLYTHLHKFFFDHIAFFFQKARGSGYKYPSRIQPDHADFPETIKQYQHAPLVGSCRVKIAPVAGATEGVNLDGGVKTPISA
jgi:hypothetical protein